MDSSAQEGKGKGQRRQMLLSREGSMFQGYGDRKQQAGLGEVATLRHAVTEISTF